MSLIQMSVSGAVMILVTIVLRALFLHRLPKKTFTVLWSVVMVRLLVPYSLSSPFSAYSLLERAEAVEQVPTNIIIPPMPDFSAINTAQATQTTSVDIPTTEVLTTTVDLLTAVWLTGVLVFSLFFAISYIRCIKKFGESLPVEDEFMSQWLNDHKLFRKISVRQSDMISTPLTYGIFRPVILLPKKLLQDKTPDLKELKYVLSHEYLHIRRFDAVFKLFLTAALCVHWFNPLMWVMFVIANRDIEISCDEGVVRMLGEGEKTDYAMALIRMEEKKSAAAPLVTHFNKNSTKERIVNIMKFKKTTVLAIISAAFLTLGTTAAFATSAKTDKSEKPPQQDYLYWVSDCKAGVPSLNNDQEIIPNGLPDYVPGKHETLEEQFKDILLNCTDPEQRMNAIFKAIQMGLTAEDFADIELSDDEIAVLKGEVPPSWWRGELPPINKIRPYDPDAFENDNNGIFAMESPDFQETIERMRQLSPEEIDNMYERFKQEPPAGRRVMTPDGEADSSEMVNKSDTADTSGKLPPAYIAPADDPRLQYMDLSGLIDGLERPYKVDIVDGEFANEMPVIDVPHIRAFMFYTDAWYILPLKIGEPKPVDHSKEYSRLERVGDVLIAYPASDE